MRVCQIFLVCMVTSLAIGMHGCASSKKSPFEVEKDAFDDMRAEIGAVVTDPARQATAIDLVSALQLSLQNLQADLRKREDEAQSLNTNYDASRGDFQRVFEAMASDLRANQAQVSRISSQLADVLTADELASIEKARSKAINAALTSIQSI